MTTIAHASRPRLGLRTAVAALVAMIASVLAVPASGGASLDLVVVGDDGDLGAVTRAVRAVGGTVTRGLPIVDAVAATVPVAGAQELLDDPAVRGVTADSPLRAQADGYDTSGRTTAAVSVGSDRLWRNGLRGEGIGIALVDTGVAAVPGLADRVVARYDLSGDGPGDGFGHGTFLAGLVVGQDGIGVAPGADLIDVKVADADGVTHLSDVLAGLDIVRRTADQHGTRIVAIALSRPASLGTDLLELAVERLWSDGLVVVTAAGNEGEIGSPGTDPLVITVGSSDDQGTSKHRDDRVPDWSGRGPTPDGNAKPDLVAPGVSLLSLRAPGSAADLAFPEARASETHFVGSGTSMSTAVVAGAIAQLLQARPDLTPNEVKVVLTASADGLRRTSSAAQGAGGLDIDGALETSATGGGQLFGWLDGLTPSVGGTLELVTGDVLDLLVGDDETWAGRSWAGRSWAGRSWAGRSWAGRSWA